VHIPIQYMDTAQLREAVYANANSQLCEQPQQAALYSDNRHYRQTRLHKRPRHARADGVMYMDATETQFTAPTTADYTRHVQRLCSNLCNAHRDKRTTIAAKECDWPGWPTAKPRYSYLNDEGPRRALRNSSRHAVGFRRRNARCGMPLSNA